MSQAFTPKRIHDYGDGDGARGRRGARARGSDGTTINLHQEMSRVTMEVVADVLFGAGMSTADVRRRRAARWRS